MPSNDNSQFNADGAFNNDTQAGWLRAMALGFMGLLPAGQVPASPGPLPGGATALYSSSGNKANTAAVATLHPATGKTAWIDGFEITGSGATVGLPVVVTVVGLLGGTLSYIFTFAVGALVPDAPLIVPFPRPLVASAVDVDIVVTLPASGAGGTNAAATAHGFYK